MPEPIIKESAELEKRLDALEAKVQQIDAELEQAKGKAKKKRPSIGYFRTRFKGG